VRITVEEAARRLGIHPFEIVRHLTIHRQATPGFQIDVDLLPTLMAWAGIEDWWTEATDSAEATDEPAPRHDPNPRRRVVRWIPFKLLQLGKIGASHTRIDNAWRGLSGDLKGFGKRVVDRMKRDGLLLSKPTVNGEHIFLNPGRLEDVQALIDWEDPPAVYREMVGE